MALAPQDQRFVSPSRRPALSAALVTLGLLAGLILGLRCQTLAAGDGGRNFAVEMVSPQHFLIQSRIPGPVSSSLMGGGGNQTLITRQENDRTIIEAVVPVGATLSLRVGPHSLRLRMIDGTRYHIDEE
jgi:hypothetical protein